MFLDKKSHALAESSTRHLKLSPRALASVCARGAGVRFGQYARGERKARDYVPAAGAL